MILGKHVLDETRDLLAVADYRFKETAKAFVDMQFSPVNENIRTGIGADWKILSEKWSVARKEIVAALILKTALYPFAVPASMIPTEEQWIAIQSFIWGQENVKGSLQDITKRIEVATGKKILYPNQPRGTSGDIDLALLAVLDEKIRVMEEAAKAAKEGAGKAATSNTGLIIGVAIVGTVVAVGAVKHYL